MLFRSLDPSCIPLMEISNQRASGRDWGSGLEINSANIANCSLKRINLNLRLRHANQVDEEIPDCEEEPSNDQLGEPDPPDADMKDDVGGDVPLPS